MTELRAIMRGLSNPRWSLSLVLGTQRMDIEYDAQEPRSRHLKMESGIIPRYSTTACDAWA